jgi:hypothetical protein
MIKIMATISQRLVSGFKKPGLFLLVLFQPNIQAS